jgi:hypothetical protein
MTSMSFLEVITLAGVVAMMPAYLLLATRYAEGSTRDGRRG